MSIRLNRQTGLKVMVIYMVMSLLFLGSMKLHIHTGDAVMLADHGAAVSISDFSAIDNVTASVTGEIEVNPDGLFKLMSKLVVFAFILLILLISIRIFRTAQGYSPQPVIPRQSLPFFGVPVLRAPPFHTQSL